MALDGNNYEGMKQALNDLRECGFFTTEKYSDFKVRTKPDGPVYSFHDYEDHVDCRVDGKNFRACNNSNGWLRPTPPNDSVIINYKQVLKNGEFVFEKDYNKNEDWFEDTPPASTPTQSQTPTVAETIGKYSSPADAARTICRGKVPNGAGIQRSCMVA